MGIHQTSSRAQRIEHLRSESLALNASICKVLGAVGNQKALSLSDFGDLMEGHREACWDRQHTC